MLTTSREYQNMGEVPAGDILTLQVKVLGVVSPCNVAVGYHSENLKSQHVDNFT